jgi:hypothetical protein
VFDVVVEGKSTDDNSSQLSGQSGTCLFTEDGHVVETTKYLRGKGVAMEFARYGHTVVVQREGRLGDASLAVQVTLHRTAEGGTHAEPAVPPVPCGVPDTDLSQNPDCGKDIPFPGAAMVLGYRGGHISLAVSRKTALKGFGSPDECGADQQTGISDALLWDWPTPVALQSAPLTARQIFGRRHAFAVTLRSSDVAPTRSTRPATLGALSGTVTDVGSDQATVRFVRRRG